MTSFREAAALMTPEALAALAAAHEELGWECPARGEGQRCCVDVLLAEAGA